MAMDSKPIPVVDLGEGEPRPARTRGARVARIAIPLLVGAVVVAGTVAAVRATHDHDRRRVVPKPDGRVATVDDKKQAVVEVESALAQTASADTYDISYRTSESQSPSSAGSAPIIGLTITGHGTVSVDPLGILTVAGVGAYGEITTRFDGTTVWETGGGNYGTSGAGTGAPLSKFAGLVLGTLGVREGAVAMNNLATATGYLALAHESITGATDLGKTTVDGIVVNVYSVDVDWLQASDDGRTSEQTMAAVAARKALAGEGYTGTTVRLSVDGDGFVRRTQTTARFSDGGTVDSDTTFSNFGCATLLPGPQGPAFAPNPAHCAG